MCGVIGYIGKKQAAPILVTALRRMEYRGYDSAGIATVEPSGKTLITKKQGQVSNLEQAMQDTAHKGVVGIGHTRWATHGAPTDGNAHPHQKGKITLIHNGIFENYQEHKKRLTEYTYDSDTDSEVLAALIDSCYNASTSPVEAVMNALRQVRGTFGIVAMFSDQPDTLVVARRSSPLLIAQEKDSIFIASDQYALAGRAAHAIVLNDDEVALCRPGQVDINSLSGDTSQQDRIELGSEDNGATLDGFTHYMQKEIFEQPESLRRVLSGRLFKGRGTSQLGGLNLTPKQLRGVRSLVFVGCGTAYHSGLAAKYLLEPLLGLPIQVETASEFRYRNVALTGHELAIAISQSGETADTIACIEELQLKGIPVLGVVNVIGSTIARMVDGGVYCHAGPEISVASTKAFTSQLTALILIGLHMARQRNLSVAEGEKLIDELETLPSLIEQTLKLDSEIERAARTCASSRFIMCLGRDTLYPIALETALKVKEITYIPTQGEAAGEMKHGSIALIGDGTAVLYLLGDNQLYEKSVSNLVEVAARGVEPVIFTDSTEYENPTVLLPHAPRTLQPFVFAVAGQLFSYHLASALEREIDKPRNLAKSVTVE